MSPARKEFWKKHPGLVWSNPDADDSIYIRAALVQPLFTRLLDVAVEFGLERLRTEWEILSSEPNPEVDRARQPVERILRNIEKGFTIAATRN